MNKAITDGVLLMPPAFAAGLDVYSSGDGTPGSDTYLNAVNAAFVPADQDFGGCLELLKTDATQKLRYMGETPLLPSCYLRISARVKAVSGNLPSVRIVAYAGGAGGLLVSGVTTTGPSVTLTSSRLRLIDTDEAAKLLPSARSHAPACAAGAHSSVKKSARAAVRMNRSPSPHHG